MVIFLASLIILINRDHISVITGAFVLENCNQFVNRLTYLIHAGQRLVSDLITIRRMHEMIDRKSEVKSGDEIVPIVKSWPKTGDIEFCNFSAFYKKECKPALNSINLIIRSGEKIGIVGRTGSGKSSLAMSLMNFFTISSGKILVDGIDISSISLDRLRSEILIIPQDIALFSDTLRFNLDPNNEYEDKQLIECVNEVRPNFLSKFTDGLDTELTHQGLNLSSGERQLICLVRALLRRKRILILDEATANMDYKTDHFVHSLIEKYFQNTTIITIAHRLDAVMNCDRIIVLSDGNIIESGKPRHLI
ncbi:unnamed protein product, partial [Medioppia subpectinata]